MYNKVDEKFIAGLQAIVGKEHVFVDPDTLDQYKTDEETDPSKFHTPEAVVAPGSTKEVAAIVKLANEANVPITVRSAGTSLSDGAIAVCGGIILLMGRMDRILEVNTEGLYMVAEAGALVKECQAAAKKHNLVYAGDPSSAETCQIGGNLATNAGGMRAMKYGVTRDSVRAITVVLPSGEIMRFGSKVVKNSSGYDLKDLIIGSEGTLGIVTEATLKIIPKPEHAISILVPFRSMRGAISTVPKIIRAQVTPVATEYMSQDVILFAEEYLGKKFPTHDSDAYLLLTFDGNTREAVMHDMETIAELCLENDAIDVYMIDTEERSASVWSARSAFLEAIKGSTDQMDECDVVVPRSLVADFILYTHEVAKTVGLRIPSFGHAGDGNLHIYLCRDGLEEKVWEQRKDRAFAMMYGKAGEIGGLVSGEHGIGLDKKEYLRQALGERQLEIMRGIKKVFDPKGILNPGKVV